MRRFRRKCFSSLNPSCLSWISYSDKCPKAMKRLKFVKLQTPGPSPCDIIRAISHVQPRPQTAHWPGCRRSCWRRASGCRTSPARSSCCWSPPLWETTGQTERVSGLRRSTHERVKQRLAAHPWNRLFRTDPGSAGPDPAWTDRGCHWKNKKRWDRNLRQPTRINNEHSWNGGSGWCCSSRPAVAAPFTLLWHGLSFTQREEAEVCGILLKWKKNQKKKPNQTNLKTQQRF